VEEAKYLTMEGIRRNCSPMYVSRGVFGWGSGRKEVLELMATFFPEFNLPSIHL